MAHFLLLYDLAEDCMERRPLFRIEHLALAREAHERGDLILAGALADPADTAVLLFGSDGPETAEHFAESDPYVTNGLVRRWRVRRWSTVVGEGSIPPPS